MNPEANNEQVPVTPEAPKNVEESWPVPRAKFPVWAIITGVLGVVAILGVGGWFAYKSLEKSPIKLDPKASNSLGTPNVTPQMNDKTGIVVPDDIKDYIVDSGEVPMAILDELKATKVGGEKISLLSAKVIPLAQTEKYSVTDSSDSSVIRFQDKLDYTAKYMDTDNPSKFYIVLWSYTVPGDTSKKQYDLLSLSELKPSGEGLMGETMNATTD